MQATWNPMRRGIQLTEIVCIALVAIEFSGTSAYASQRRATGTQSIAVKDTVTANLVSHAGATRLNERGRGAGTLPCPSLWIKITISYTTAHIAFTCSAHAGTIWGQGDTKFYASGKLAHFHGNLSITHGTGRYDHANASSLYIAGTLYRHNYAVSATITGLLRL